jgi:hypothetical protein
VPVHRQHADCVSADIINHNHARRLCLVTCDHCVPPSPAHSPHCWQNLKSVLPHPFRCTASARMCSMQSWRFQQYGFTLGADRSTEHPCTRHSLGAVALLLLLLLCCSGIAVSIAVCKSMAAICPVKLRNTTRTHSGEQLVTLLLWT